MRAWYATRERVMRAADVKAAAYLAPEIDTAIEAASTAVDRFVNLGDPASGRPGFAPWEGSITFDWPVQNNHGAWRFWLNQFRLHRLDSVISGDDDLTGQTYGWPASGPPFQAIDVNTAGPDSLGFTTGTGQRSLVIAGGWGEIDSDETRTGWTLGANVSASATGWTINAPIGIGSIVLVGTERVMVTDRMWLTSGQNSAGALAAQLNVQNVSVADGSLFLANEEIIVDSERMLVRDVVGNTLIVNRAVGGSTLAAHSPGATIYWSRLCQVERGALGTTAAAHTTGDTVWIYRAPAMVEQLTVAYALEQRAQENSAYARSLGTGEDTNEVSGRGIKQLEARVLAAYGRIRHRAI